MADRLAIINWDLVNPGPGTPPETGDWQAFYPAAALPFLTEFPSSPDVTPSIQYRDADTGELLSVHPYPETPDYVPGGHFTGDSDIAYGPNIGATRSNYLYFCGWASASVWKMQTDTNTQVWRDTGFQFGFPDPPFYSFDPFPLLSPDGTRLYTNNDSNSKLAVLNTADGSVVNEITVIGSVNFNTDQAGKVWAPDGQIIFSYNGGPSAATHGLYKFDLTTGIVTPFLMLPSLGLPYNTVGTGANYLYAYSLAAHPGGDGFVFALNRYDGSYHSELVEVAFDGTVGNMYSYAASGLDGDRLAMFFSVTYSSDGTKLYSVGDTAWPIIWKFDRGPGNVGGSAPWMHCDYRDTANWAMDGFTHTFGGANALWLSTISGIAAYSPECVPPANDNFSAAQVLTGDVGSVAGTTVCATLEVGEPSYLGQPNTVWYKWTAPEFGNVTFELDSGGVWIRMEIYTGADLASLTGPHGAQVTDIPLPLIETVEGGDVLWIRVHNDLVGDEGPFILSWDFVATPTIPPRTPTTLGCSQHVAYIQTKCNGPRLCELSDITSLGYDRRLDDISEAFVEVAISGDVDAPCCSCLADVEPWCHQLTIVREGDGVVWTGPVQKIIYSFDKVRIEAKDKLAWLLVRTSPVDEDFASNTTVPLTTVAKEIIQAAMIQDDDSPCFLDCILDLGDGLGVSSTARGRFFFAFGGPTVYDDLLTLAESAIDFTVMNQCLILSSHKLPDVAIGTLTDEHILGNIDVVKDGTLQGNRFIVRYDQDDDPVICSGQGSLSLPCPAVRSGDQECYGLVERLIPNSLNLPNVDAAGTVADILLANNRIAPRLVQFSSGTQLSPNTPWVLNDMIPGQRIDVAISKLCLPVFQSFKLQQVTVEDGAEGEKISIDLKALNNPTG